MWKVPIRTWVLSALLGLFVYFVLLDDAGEIGGFELGATIGAFLTIFRDAFKHSKE